MASVVDATPTPAHPYYPRSALIPHYVPNTYSSPTILVGFGTPVALIGIVTFILTGLIRPNAQRPRLSFIDRVICAWFAICAGIHIILEGYFVVNHRTLAGESTFLAQVWKEYALGDSRYLRSDLVTLCVEGITAALEGPVSLLIIIATIYSWPSRYVMQLCVSIGQIYGLLIYYFTEFFAEESNSDPHWLYYWVYFVGINFFWMIMPIFISIRAWFAMSASTKLADDRELTIRGKKRQ
jgi:cholestenol delta-isomerase